MSEFDPPPSSSDSPPGPPLAAPLDTPPAPSVGRALEQAFTRTRAVLFTHGSFGGWLVLGFAALLAFLFESGSMHVSGTEWPSVPWPQPNQGPLDYLRQELGAALPAVAVGGMLALALGIALLWLRSRGRFIFLEGVLTARPAIVEPWRAMRPLANHLFGFWLLLAGVAGALLFLAALAAIALGWENLQHQRITPAGTAGLTVLITVGGFVSIGYAVTKFLMDDLLIPTMYARRVSWRQGWAIIRDEIVRPYPGATALYLLLRIGAAIVIGLLETVAICATCCLALIPYVSHVILLPLTVFRRCLPLTFLEQLGPAWSLFNLPDQPPHCLRCGYDLRGNPAATHCPECGNPLENFDWTLKSRPNEPRPSEGV